MTLTGHELKLIQTYLSFSVQSLELSDTGPAHNFVTRECDLISGCRVVVSTWLSTSQGKQHWVCPSEIFTLISSLAALLLFLDCIHAVTVTSFCHTVAMLGGVTGVIDLFGCSSLRVNRKIL